MENYENLGTIGEGTYGVVMKARHRETGQIVAIKKFKESEDDDQVRKTALREVRILKQLRHDNIVNLIDVFRRKGKLYLVFEHADHTILEDLEKNPDGIDEGELKKILYQLLASIDFCHTHNIIHRDIKPENLLVTKNGVLKLCDFGFARVLSAPGAKYTDYVATRWYRAPELLVGDTEYSKPVDVWAIGCLVAEMKTGAPLFPGESDIDQLRHIMKAFGPLPKSMQEVFERNPLYTNVNLPSVLPEDVQPITQRYNWSTQELMAFLQSCLAYEPDQRASTTDLLKHPFFEGFSDWFQQELRFMVERDSQVHSSYRKRRSRKKEDTNGTEGGLEREGSAGRGQERASRNRESREGREPRDKDNGGFSSKYPSQYNTLDGLNEDNRDNGQNGCRSSLNSRGNMLREEQQIVHSVSKESLRGNNLRVVAFPSLASELDDGNGDSSEQPRRKKYDQFPSISSNAAQMAANRYDQQNGALSFPNVYDNSGSTPFNPQFDGIVGSGFNLVSDRRKRNQKMTPPQTSSEQQRFPSKGTKPRKGMPTNGQSPTTSLYQAHFPPSMVNMDTYISLPKSPVVEQSRNISGGQGGNQFGVGNSGFGKYANGRRFG